MFRVVAAAVAVLLVSGGSLAAYSTWRLTEKVQQHAIALPGENVPSVAALDGSFNVLLVGADNAAGQHSFGKAREATLNDVDILVHVSADHTRGTVISFPRDLVIPHPKCRDPNTGQTYAAMTAQPLNVAFERGGLGCVVDTVEHLTGLAIPYAALFSFAGTVKMADAVGGVPVCMTRAIDDSKSGLHLPAGTSVVSGRTALAYLRERKRIGDGSDLGRIASQQAYMSALLRKMTAAGTLTDPAKLYSLANAAADNVSLSQSLAGLDRMVQMAVTLRSIDLDQMVFVQYPTQADPANSYKVIPNASLATELLDRVHRDQRVALGTHALGISATTAPSSTPSNKPHIKGTPSPTTAPTDGAEIAGLTGTTAAQHTCTVTRTDN
ncbi:LCP family protein [Amnibacterium endophyticum]|uniref:LCP family protein n=1 Tax=Amnibacterium endophyticum TaxID=2109337 RepID=A0ABW4LHI5_9MICO